MKTRQPAVAGSFYPANTEKLEATISTFLTNTPIRKLSPKILIVPHAGYIYSGQTAASAYRLLEEQANTIRKVILLGPSHRTHFRGVALPDCDAFSTPLGSVPLDIQTMQALLRFNQVHIMNASHVMEHSLEVQLPFLQQCLNNFLLVPLVVGDASPMAVAEILESIWGGDETLIVISTDLSHYHTYEEACARDATTIRLIEQLTPNLTGGQACGCQPLNGLLEVAQKKGMQVSTLDICNSGDTAGDKNRVVGYAAFSLQ
ncbi:MAG: AmmeMemoRadiSam system protein B [Endozoicomonadaceae bacterium]|nr:AmmeMemoRadiSam system protein B [Endozoicomonadaceae bacterium]